MSVPTIQQEDGQAHMNKEGESLLSLREAVALALVHGEWEGEPADLIPQDVWDGLFEKRLLITTSDVSGEAYPYITPQGRKRLAELVNVGE